MLPKRIPPESKCKIKAYSKQVNHNINSMILRKKISYLLKFSPREAPPTSSFPGFSEPP